jgi:DNA helicase HerA-like ATPase
MNKEIAKKFEPVAKILAANALSQTFSFCMERKYIDQITDIRNKSSFNLKAIVDIATPHAPMWIEIEQIGRPLSDQLEDCFVAIQKILHSCFLPRKSQLLFLVTSTKKGCKMYLGIRTYDSQIIGKTFVSQLQNFIAGMWPGLQCKIVNEKEDTYINEIKYNCSDSGKYNYFHALTGIPSMETNYKTTYPATIDKLMAGMTGKIFTYLVVADPIHEIEVEKMLYQCRDMNGQAESLKALDFSESNQFGISKSLSKAHTLSKTITDSISTSKKDFSSIGKLALDQYGMAIAADIFPAAGAVFDGIYNTTGAVLAGAEKLLGTDILSSMMPTMTESTSISDGTADTDTISEGFSENQSKSISEKIVNKHIEAVSEHLFYHSKRLESGKALGSWKVGVYLMAEKESDINGSSLQLRAILSGQESIFEPIRIHDINTIMNQDINGKCIKDTSLAKLNSPNILIYNANGNRFDHPLGDNYKELKTVLTTKELSYLINFPLRSVPGISVIDSTPEFSLNQPIDSGEESINIGKLLYGGSETNMEYKIPVASLAKHTLLSGINGSGKTNTVQAILNNLAKNMPFLVIEPAKTEYVDWALEYNKNHTEDSITIYIPGCKTFRSKNHLEGYKLEKQLKLNPFEIVWLDKEQDPNVLTHIDRLKSTFAAAFPMYDILPVLMEDLIYTVYQNKSTDWLTQQPEYGKTIPPTLNSMSISVDKVISNRQYEERIERNMKACLNTRIDSLKRGWKGEMLNTIHSTNWKELFEKRCIINLSYVGDDVDKAFFMALILQFLYEYRAAQAELGHTDFNDNTCKHLTVIEEAHRVMSNCTNPEMPQYKSAMMFSNMLSEIRAYGEGLFLVDQVPTRLIPDAIKNTNLKITHRLVAEDDSRSIGESMGLSEEQRKIIPKLMTGQCLVAGSLSPETYWIKVDKMK